MESEKTGLPPYSAVVATDWRKRWSVRRSRTVRFCLLACLAFIAYAQWRQLKTPGQQVAHLSVDKLNEDLALCSTLRSKPKDPVGAGRDRNARYVDGHKPTLIRNATIWVGEPAKGTSDDDAHTGKGFSWVTGDVLVENGLIKQVGKDLDLNSLSSDPTLFNVWDAKGRPLTSGIIDMHSHAGVDSLPALYGNDDVNEMSTDITPYVRSIDGIMPNDHQIQVIKSGGVTTSLILPGSSNNIGGEAFLVKHAVGKADGRNETSATDMLADPEHNWRYIKMACGENPKREFGKVGERGPISRLGESWEFRHAFEQAASLVRAQNDWCDAAESIGVEKMNSYLPQDLKWETLGAVLRGQVHVNTHCYTIPDLEAFVDHTIEFNFSVRAFHHAHQTYLVPEILKRTWGDSPPASALFADNMYYKAESYVGSEYAGKVLYENGLTPIYVSDNPVLNAQHVVFEAAKAFGYGLPYHAAMASVTTAPAERLGMGERLGKIKPGYDADIVVWDSDPMSVGATPVQVWIDGTAQFEDPIELEKPFTALADTPEPVPVTSEEPLMLTDVIFTGVAKPYLVPSQLGEIADGYTVTVEIANSRIRCVGTCTQQLESASASGVKVIHLNNGYLVPPFTAVGSLVGLNAIDAEPSTDDSGTRIPAQFSRAVDGLALDTKKLRAAHRYGVTRAVTAPRHHGVAAGFRTGATHALADRAVFQEETALYYTLDNSAKRDGASISGEVGALRRKLLDAVAHNGTDADPFSEAAYLRRVVQGGMPLVVAVHSADTIAAVLRAKRVVDDAIQAEATTTLDRHKSSTGIQLVVLGGAEAHLLAAALARAHVAVVLAPLLSYRVSWDQRRALTGAPLTNGTAVDALVAAGVRVAVGLDEDWVVRDLGLLAGIAHTNSQGRIGEKAALDLIGANFRDILGIKEVRGVMDEFVVFEGSPLEVGSRVRAVGDGLGSVRVFDYA
ncbi:amidohydrolase [Xylariomycetidae sp. FL0641]|nr:amidohydrolase [Xylariomycetidae sp. FL0641]